MSYKKDLERIERVSAKGEASWEAWSELVLSLLTNITESLKELENLQIGTTQVNYLKELESMKEIFVQLKKEISKELETVRNTITLNDAKSTSILEELKQSYTSLDTRYTLKLSTFLRWVLPIAGSYLLYVLLQYISKNASSLMEVFK